MGLGDILAKLKSVKDLILEKAPDALDRIADVCGQMNEAARDAAEWLRGLSAANALVKGPKPEEYEEFDSFINDLRNLSKKSVHAIVKMREDEDTDLSAAGQSNLLKALLSLTAGIEDKLHESAPDDSDESVDEEDSE